MTEIDTETVIIGGGQTGVPLARALTAEGRPVILIERARLGLLREFRLHPEQGGHRLCAPRGRCQKSREPRHSHSLDRGGLSGDDGSCAGMTEEDQDVDVDAHY